MATCRASCAVSEAKSRFMLVSIEIIAAREHTVGKGRENREIDLTAARLPNLEMRALSGSGKRGRRAMDSRDPRGRSRESEGLVLARAQGTGEDLPVLDNDLEMQSAGRAQP